jgi:hypothetical protein
LLVVDVVEVVVVVFLVAVKVIEEEVVQDS